MQPLVRSILSSDQLFCLSNETFLWTDGTLEKISTLPKLVDSKKIVNAVLGAPYALCYIHNININSKVELRGADSYFLGFSQVPELRRRIYRIGQGKEKKIIIHAHITDEGEQFLNTFENTRFIPLPLFTYLRFCVLIGKYSETEHYDMSDEMYAHDHSFQLYTNEECMLFHAGSKNMKYCRLSNISQSKCYQLYSERHPEYSNPYTIKYTLTDTKSLIKFLVGSSKFKEAVFPTVRLIEHVEKQESARSNSMPIKKTVILAMTVCLLLFGILSGFKYRQILLEDQLSELKLKKSVVSGKNHTKEAELAQILLKYKHAKENLFNILKISDEQKNGQFWLEAIEKSEKGDYMLILNFIKGAYSYGLINEYLHKLKMELTHMETLSDPKYGDDVLGIKLKIKNAES